MVDIDADYCALSPGGRFLHVVRRSDKPIWEYYHEFYNATTGARVAFPLPSGALDQGGLWLRDETFFAYAHWTTAYLNGSTGYHVPQDGWLIDVASGRVTDVLTLDPAARDATLALAAERDQPRGVPGSPDGRYQYWYTKITDTSGNTVNQIDLWRGQLQGCDDGWHPDSIGHYIIDRRPVGLFGTEPGPIRLFLVHPPSRWTAIKRALLRE